MGRPKLHDEATAVALLDAAERIAEAEGAQAITVRRVAEAVGTTTRAVYTAFGSKEALVIALGRRAFDLLRDEIEALPATADPTGDLVEAGATVFRRFAVEHPALFEIGVLKMVPDTELFEGYRDAALEALAGLTARVERLPLRAPSARPHRGMPSARSTPCAKVSRRWNSARSFRWVMRSESGASLWHRSCAASPRRSERGWARHREPRQRAL